MKLDLRRAPLPQPQMWGEGHAPQRPIIGNRGLASFAQPPISEARRLFVEAAGLLEVGIPVEVTSDIQRPSKC